MSRVKASPAARIMEAFGELDDQDKELMLQVLKAWVMPMPTRPKAKSKKAAASASPGLRDVE